MQHCSHFLPTSSESLRICRVCAVCETQSRGENCSWWVRKKQRVTSAIAPHGFRHIRRIHHFHPLPWWKWRVKVAGGRYFETCMLTSGMQEAQDWDNWDHGNHRNCGSWVLTWDPFKVPKIHRYISWLCKPYKSPTKDEWSLITPQSFEIWYAPWFQFPSEMFCCSRMFKMVAPPNHVFWFWRVNLNWNCRRLN